MNNGGTTEIPTAWILDPELLPTDLGTLARILALCDHDGRVRVTIDDLSIGVGRYAVRASLTRLIDGGWLERERIRNAGTYRGVEYRVLGREIHYT